MENLLLLFIKLLSLAGCTLSKPDGSGNIDLDVPGTTIFVAAGEISDDEPPGFLTSYSTEGISSVFQGMA